MNNIFNKIEYLELLKKQSINEKLNSKDFGRLLDYGTVITNYLNWCIREHYLDLLENFQKEKLQTFDFCKHFEDSNEVMSDFVEVLESNLIILSPTDKSLVFADLLQEIFYETEAYLQAADVDTLSGGATNYDFEQHEIMLKELEVDLKKSVAETYLKIQNFLKEE